MNARAGVQRMLDSESGTLRVLLLLAVIWTLFALAHDRFLSPMNLTNLTLQVAAVGTISVGVVLVLLLGEIDLSVGAVSGLAAASVAVLSVHHGWNAAAAIIAGLVVGALIGAFQGAVATRLEIPSFVVTLAGLLAFQGAQLKVLGSQGTINLSDSGITGIANTFLDHATGWVLALIASGALAESAWRQRRARARAGLELLPLANTLLRCGLGVVAIIAAVVVLNQDRGVPLALVVLAGIAAIFNLLITRTRVGRHILAVGGNAEAARRAGIRVVAVRTLVFALASTLAAAGGIIAASRLYAVNQSSGGSDLLLLSIAGPVIAGVSLFGGRGSVWAAVFGALIIGSISNGMDLLALDSSVKFMVTGFVLLAAVSLDAVARKRRQSRGGR